MNALLHRFLLKLQKRLMHILNRYTYLIIILIICSTSLSLVLALKTPTKSNSSKYQLHEAMFYEKLDNHQVKCRLCFKNCIIDEGKIGFCNVRQNKEGILYSLVYGKPAGMEVDPIELEPMYHFRPGHKILCVFTASCNFRCMYCHNWPISQRTFFEVRHFNYTPEEIVETAIKQGTESISFTINEPTIFYEYMYDISKLAKQRGLRILFHTNGSINPEPLKKLLKYVDAATVDLKGFCNKFYTEITQGDLYHVLEILKIIYQHDVHLEIVNLVIPTLNDNFINIENMSIWIRDNLSEYVPLHFTRFSPAYKKAHLPPTLISTLEKAREIALEQGLKHVYIGNVYGHEGNHTFCPQCNKKLVERSHFIVKNNKMTESGKCKYCNASIVGIW